MKTSLRHLRDRLIDDQGVSMEIRLYRVVVLAVTLLNVLLVIPVNLLQDLSPYINLTLLLYASSTAGLCMLSLRGRNHVLLFYLITIVVLNITWMLNGGSFGSVSNYFFAVLLYLLFFFRGRTRLITLVLLIVDNCALLLAEYFYPSLVTNFNSRLDRLIDLNAGFTTSVITCSLVFWIVIKALETELEQRKRVEKALTESEDKLWTTLQSTADGILAIDSDGKLLHANQRFMDLWRVPPGLVEAGDDRRLLEFVLHQLADPEAFLDKVQRLYASGDTSTDTLLFKDGRVFERNSNPIVTEGDVTGRVWSFHDISDRMRAEDELNKKNADIEQFIYTASHDLRSPLVTVKTFLGFLESDINDGDRELIARDLQFIHTAADKMKLLLDELLEMSRIDRIEVPPVTVAFSGVVSEALDALAGTIIERRVEIRRGVEDPLLFGERPRLCQIWQNLIENAVKYSRDDCRPLVEIGVRTDDRETVFYVRDNGIGIDPRFRDKIFGVFEKLDPASPGAGMGLAMISRVVYRYGGRIWVESEGSDSGSCFCFTLPYALTGAEHAAAPPGEEALSPG